jgi:transposase InsO family protein
MTNEQREIKREERILDYAERHGNINMTCRRFGIARLTFYIDYVVNKFPFRIQAIRTDRGHEF